MSSVLDVAAAPALPGETTQGDRPMQKVHGPPVETPVHARQRYLDQPTLSALVVSLALLLMLCALIYFGFVGTS